MYKILYLGFVLNKFPWDEITRNCLFVCLPNAEEGASNKRQPKEAADEEKQTSGGAVPTEESPKTDEVDAKPSRTSKYFVIETTSKQSHLFWRLLQRVTIIFVLCYYLLSPSRLGNF